MDLFASTLKLSKGSESNKTSEASLKISSSSREVRHPTETLATPGILRKVLNSFLIGALESPSEADPSSMIAGLELSTQTRILPEIFIISLIGRLSHENSILRISWRSKDDLLRPLSPIS